MSPSVSVSVPPWATWTWNLQHRKEEHARRCCIDELGSRLAAHVPVLKLLAVLNATMPATLRFTACDDAKAHVCWKVVAALLRVVDAWLRGASQVVIVNNPVAGILIMAALFFPSSTVAMYGLLGLTGATAAAILLKLDPQALASGLFGYNGLLVGMALATFLSRDHAWDAPVATACVAMGGMSTLIQLALGNVLVPTFRSPPFTLAFNITFLAFLLATAQWSNFRMPHQAPSSEALAAADAAPTAEAAANVDVSLGWLLHAALISVGQIFLCESPISGALILAGMAVSSRIAALAAFAGPVLANALAVGLGADRAAIGSGLWGYNSSLTCVATLTFFAPSSRACVMAALGTTLTVLLDGALRSAFEPVHMPIGTLPFCLASLTLMLTHSKVPGFEAIPLSDVATAEDHFYAARVTRVADASLHSDVHSSAAAPDPYPVVLSKERSSNRPAMESVPEWPSTPPPQQRDALIVSRPGTRESSVHAGNLLRELASTHGSRRGSASSGTILPSGSTTNGGGSSSTVPEAAGAPPIMNTLHGGSMHGEHHVARQLAAMSTSSGHGGRALEFAFRAAAAIGISPTVLTPSLSREGTVHGEEHLASLQALIAERSDASGRPEPSPAALGEREVCVTVQD